MGEINYEPLINTMTWSYSRVSCYNDCPYKWFMKYILDRKEVPLFYNSYGTVVHKVLELYYKGELKEKDLVGKFLVMMGKNNVTIKPPSYKIFKNYLESGLEYFKNFHPLPYEVLDIEKEIRFKIGKCRFVCFIDFLGRDEDGLVIIDHKSRNIKPRSKRKIPTKNDEELDEMFKQLYLYAEAVYQEYGEYPTKLGFNCFRNGNLIVEDFDKDKCEKIKQEITDNINLIKKDKEFNPDRDLFKCYNLCGLHDECYCWLGR